MASYFDVHPDNPQPRSLNRVVQSLEDGEVVAIPTDSAYALACKLGNKDALETMRRIRKLPAQHHFTLLISEFAQVGRYVEMGNRIFRAVKAATPGPFTFILPATRETPRAMAVTKKRTVGVRIPDHRTSLALLDMVGEPLAVTTLWLPDEPEPMYDGWLVAEALNHQIAAVVDSGDCGRAPTTVVDLSTGVPELLRDGAGDLEKYFPSLMVDE